MRKNTYRIYKNKKYNRKESVVNETIINNYYIINITKDDKRESKFEKVLNILSLFLMIIQILIELVKLLID